MGEVAGVRPYRFIESVNLTSRMVSAVLLLTGLGFQIRFATQVEFEQVARQAKGAMKIFTDFLRNYTDRQAMLKHDPEPCLYEWR